MQVPAECLPSTRRGRAANLKVIFFQNGSQSIKKFKIQIANEHVYIHCIRRTRLTGWIILCFQHIWRQRFQFVYSPYFDTCNQKQEHKMIETLKRCDECPCWRPTGFNIPDLLDDIPKHLSNGRSRWHTESLSQATFSRWSGILSHQFRRVILSNVHHCLWGKYCAIHLIISIISSTKHWWHDAAQRYLKFDQTDRQAYLSSERMSKFNLGKFKWYGVSIAWV